MQAFISALLSITLLLSSMISCYPTQYQESIYSTSLYYENETTEVPADTPKTDTLGIASPSALLMEASTGTVIYEKDAHAVLHPASVTKIMTLLLIFDALENGTIHLEDTVTVSDYAASMGGSQVFLEPGETQSVDTMIKCISVASANDACVAMAELISGTESEFVASMNARAKDLGMNDTNFVNCCGLDVDNHMTSAYDIALMSRELLEKYPQIHDYCTVWMENITHTTARGSSEFGLTNTNKLIRQYQYATGLKTGSTSLAKYCVSASAKKDNIELIAVIMASPDSKTRFADAANLLNYGFSKCQIYTDPNTDALPDLPVQKGVLDNASISYQCPFQYVNVTGDDLSSITKELNLPDKVSAPVKSGDEAGCAIYKLNGTEIGSVPLIFNQDIAKATFKDYFFKILKRVL